MSYSMYYEKDSSDIYEEFSVLDEDDSTEDEERSTDRMEEMISKYGNY